MSQTPGIVMIPNMPLFLFTLVLFAIEVAGYIWLVLHEKDLHLWKREEEQEINEAYANLASYVQISAQGLLSDRWEFLYKTQMSHSCILCGRNYLHFDYQVYRDNSRPENTILFASHYCPSVKGLSPYDAQQIAEDYEDDLKQFMDRFQLGEQDTQLVPVPLVLDAQREITLKRQRAFHSAELTPLVEAMSE